MTYIGSNPQPLLLPKLTQKIAIIGVFRFQMRVLFQSQDLWDVMEEGIEEPGDEDEVSDGEIKECATKWKKDNKALFPIYQVVDETIFERISQSNSSKEAWDMLYNT
ncbi:hypothetical protein LXL04_008884 [Taraxacum kok-saghyz]